MANLLSDIPIKKQNELNLIKEIIINLGKKYLKPEIIITFGNYIKNDLIFPNMVREGDQVVFYKELISIIIIVKRPNKYKYSEMVTQINAKIKNTTTIESNVEILVDDIFSFNDGLREGRYFYLDIFHSGILLYDSLNCKIKNKKNLSLEDLEKIKKEDFEAWHEIALEFYTDYKNSFLRKSYRISAFYLHQCVESYLTCYLLVKSGYKPRTHDLEILYTKVKSFSKRFNKFFDLESESYYFNFLNSSYIDSRYKKNYKVKKKDLVFIESKVNFLGELVKKLCLKELSK